MPLLPEAVLALVGIGAFYVFPTDLGFLTTVVTTAILVLSLDLLLGYTGIATLGQAAMFGTGAYAAGLFALHVSADPILGLAVGAATAAVVALVSGALLMRTHGLAFLMLTIAVAELILAAANSFSGVTGGMDGLYGFAVAPLFGVFGFDFYGRTGYLYSLGVLVAVFFVLRRLMGSAFGLSARGLRSDRTRMSALGAPVYAQLLVVYTIGGAIAGLGGALSAQTTSVVGLDSLSFTLSAEALVMLVLGGTGRLYGALVGTVIFMGVHHIAANIDPATWMLVIGALLIVTVLALPRGLLQLFESTVARLYRAELSHE